MATMTTEPQLLTYEDPFPGRSGDELIWETCGRCAGQGYIREYSHIDDGRCFECDGRPHWDTPVRVLRQRESARISRANAEIRKAHRAQLEIEANTSNFEAAYPEVWRWIELNRIDPDNRFAASLLKRVESKGELTENQIAAVLRQIEEDAAPKPLLPEGRQEVVGKIISIKERDSFYAPNRTEWKMVVEAVEGWRVWGTRPAAISEAQVGDRVRFTATLTRSDDAQDFGFFKRPAKAEVQN